MPDTGFKGKIDISINLKPLQELQRKSPEMFKKAQKVAAIQFLTWANNGSANTSRKPPIRWGVLRGSSSGFVGDVLISIFPSVIKPGAPDEISPAESYSGKEYVITWVWNTDYAARLHETEWDPGIFSTQDGDTGNKWVEIHLLKDKDDLMKVIGLEFKRLSGI